MSVSLAPRGLTFVQVIRAAALAKGDLNQAAAYAEEMHGFGSPVARILKAGISAGGLIAGSNWGSEAGTFQGAAAEFFGLVEQTSIVGRLSGIRKIPLNTKVLSATSGSTGYWVGEGKAKPVSKMVFDDSSLPPLKVAALVVLTMELLQNSDPRTESWIRADLLRAIVEVLDATFLDASGAAVSSVSPASILDGATAVAGSGTMATDIQNLLEHFLGNLESAFFVMSSYAATQVSGAAYPNVGARGGEIAGVPVITSSHVPDGIVALIDATGIAVSDGEASVKVSRQASIEMDSAPTNASSVPTGTTMVSLFQVNAVAVLTEKVANWTRLRADAVAYLEGSTWAIQSATT